MSATATRIPPRPLRWLPPVAAILLVAAGTAWAIRANTRAEPAPTTAPPAEARPLFAQAQAVPSVQSKLAPAAGGMVKRVAVDVGQAVKEGDLLVELDGTAAALKVDEARASLTLQKALLAQAREPASPSDVAAARASLDGAEAKLRQLEAGPTAGELRAAEEAVAAAQAAVAGAEARLRQVRAGSSPGDVAGAGASVRQAEAAVAQAEAKLAELRARPRAEDVRQVELGLEQARNALWAQQVSRDATCGRGADSAACQSANAQVAAAETAVSGAAAKVESARQPAPAEEVRAAEEAVAGARAAVMSARARQGQVEGGPAGWDVDAAASAVAGAAANARAAEARLAQLRAGPTAGEVDAAKAAVEAARAALEGKLRGPSPAALEAAQARVTQAEVVLTQAEAALAQSALRAPFAGIVTTLTARAGEVVAAGGHVLTLAKLDDLRFETKDLDEVSAARVRVGQEVDVVVAALEGRRLKGRLTHLAPQPVTSASGDVYYTATIELAEPAPELRWGMTARAELGSTG